MYLLNREKNTLLFTTFPAINSPTPLFYLFAKIMPFLSQQKKCSFYEARKAIADAFEFYFEPIQSTVDSQTVEGAVFLLVFLWIDQ